MTENGRVQELSVSVDKVGVSKSQISADCKMKNIPCEVNEMACLTCWAAFCKLSSGSLLLLRKSRSLFSLGGASFLRCGLGAWYSILWKTLWYNDRLSPLWITTYWQTVTYKSVWETDLKICLTGLDCMNEKLDSVCKWQDYLERRVDSLISIPVKSIIGCALHELSSESSKGKRFIPGVWGSYINIPKRNWLSRCQSVQ